MMRYDAGKFGIEIWTAILSLGFLDYWGVFFFLPFFPSASENPKMAIGNGNGNGKWK